MSLNDRLEEIASPGNQPEPKRTAPSGWEPGIKYEPNSWTVTTEPQPHLSDPESWGEAVKSLGIEIPVGWTVRLMEARYDPAAWHRDEPGEDAYTKPIWRYRFSVQPEIKKADAEELLQYVGKRKNIKPSSVLSAETYVVVISDMQWGKVDGGGSEEILRNLMESHAKSLKKYKELKKKNAVYNVLILLPGDCIEGTMSGGGNRLSRLDLTLTEMLRVYRRTTLAIVQDYADLADKVTVSVVPGNHDEAIRTGNQLNTTYDDSHAVEGASIVADTLQAAGYENCEFIFPKKDELTTVVEVTGTVIGLVHGHQTRGKMQTWLANQALGRHAIGTADIVVSGHYHHFHAQQLGPTLWIQSPALDGGSVWFRHSNGVEAPKGMLTFVTADGMWSSLDIL
jgi:predicted phosphodiesterase